MRIVAMIRAKNEARWIERVIRSLLPLCDHIYIMDDHSTDETAEIAGGFDQATVFDSPFEGFNETRDKSWLLRQIIKAGGADYVLCVDGDEELEPSGPKKIRNLLKRGKVQAACLKIIYLWDKPDQWRTDGVYGQFFRASLFRLDPKMRDYHSDYATTLHCTNVPAGMAGAAVHTDIRLLHWGYFDRDLRLKKYNFYTGIDPGNSREDFYRHVVQGDVEDVPATAKLLHAGPLRLEPVQG